MKQTERLQAGTELKITFLLLFALSGASALVYQVVWVRQLTPVLGASTYAVTIILAAFMSGLAVGSWLLGRLSDRWGRDVLAAAYVVLECGIGLYAVFLPLLLAASKAVFIRLSSDGDANLLLFNTVRLGVSFSLFLFPTVLMGATLPILVRCFASLQTAAAVTVSRLYAANTAGAVVGTVMCGYVLLPALGNARTNLLAAAVNFLIAAVFLVHYRRLRSQAGQPLEKSTDRRAAVLSGFERVVVVCFLLSGAAAMMYEIAWTRSLSMVLGTTTYAFTTMLATFLLGIAIGGALYPRLRAMASPASCFAGAQYLTAFSVVLTIPLFGVLPFLYLSFHNGWVNDWLGVQVVRFVLAALVMFVPTVALGSVLPIVSGILLEHNKAVGGRLGKAYGFNTIGAVIGSLVAGLVLIPAIGMQKTIVVGAIINFTAGSVVFLLSPGGARAFRGCCATAAAAVLIMLLVLLRPWSPRIMSSGVYTYGPQYGDMLERVRSAGGSEALPEMSPWQLWKAAMQQYEVLYYGTGPTATVAVMERPDGVRFLSVDGKTDASSNFRHDMRTQVMLGQLPMLFHASPQNVFVVGLGSGVTVGSALTHPVDSLDCAEFSKEIIRAAAYFAHVNHNALEDPRLNIIHRDARNVLLTRSTVYDVIISQPSNPWISGQSSLFSQEWYRLAASRLAAGGIFAQWVPAYHMDAADVRTIAHTLRSVFPHTTAWTSSCDGELILIAVKDRPLEVSYEMLQKRLAMAAVRADIERLGCEVDSMPSWAFLMSEEKLETYVHENVGEPLLFNTDDRLITEFSTPKMMCRQQSVVKFKDIGRMELAHGAISAIFPGIEMGGLSD